MHSIRWKLIALTLLVVIVPIYFLNQKAVEAFNEFTSKSQESEMISHARIIGAQYRVFIGDAGAGERAEAKAQFADMLVALGPKLQSRIRVLSPDGIVLVDSSRKPMTGADLSTYQEVVRAMHYGYGSRWKLDADEGRVYYYIAVPVEHEGQTLAYVHVLRHTGPIIKAILAIQRDQRVALLLALAGAVLAAAILAQTLTWRLRRLSRSAREFARTGRFDSGVGGADEIGELSSAMRRMAEDLDARNHYNRDFVATVMHELKAPLTAIKGAAEILEDSAGDRPDSRRKFLGNIGYEVDRLIRMVGELSGLTRFDTEDPATSHEAFDLVNGLRELEGRIETMFPGDRAVIRFTLPDEAGHVRGNMDRLEQVFVNLLDNAIRYTPPDGAIDVRCVVNRDTTVVRVADNGHGISDSNLPKIFDRFFTTEPKGRTADYGSGLGLAVARAIVERHHGTIAVDSTQGVGTCFTVTLPSA